ncbi:MAG TPA: xanthine dehydrogenase family protein molybdopterin-binding subunit [Vicinamibacterales bacterium]|nr:xanthine dehydrogenase family protein molybdopterin-binding subunit [Vicinamibacterales bacterium]
MAQTPQPPAPGTPGTPAPGTPAPGTAPAPGTSAQALGTPPPPAQVFPPVDPSKFKLIGQNYQTQDLMAKVTGKARYAEDYRAEGMLFCKLMLSPRPHARILSIDASRALAMPGVHAVLTADDLPAPPPPAGPPPAAGSVPSAAAAGGVAPTAPQQQAANAQRAANAPAAGPGAVGAPGTPPSAAAVPPAQQTPQTPPIPGEFALAKEAMYEGEPILAVAADSEELAAAAIEAIRVTFAPLDFVIDPLDGLRPGGPNGRTEGNVFVGGEVKTIKWTAAQFDELAAGRFPQDAEHGDLTSWGNVEQGFKEADLIVEHIHYQQSTVHQPLETRSAMAYWQNGKLYLHGSTQSVARTVAAVAGWVGIPQKDVVIISEYTGGGFGSKIPGAQTMAIPALLSKKLNGRPVMMRITREEETYIGRTRPGFQAWAKMGFKKDGRVTAVDTFIIEDSGPYRRQGDNAQAANLSTLLYTAPNARFRGLSVATNTPPRTSQRAPGGLQSAILFEPLVNKAAKQLGLDQVEIRKINAPVNGSTFGLNPPAQANRPRPKITSSYLKEALDRGAALFNWEERKQRNGQRIGTKVTGVAVSQSTFTAGSTGVDGLFVIKPDGKMYIHQGIGNLGTHSVIDTARVIAEVLEFPWEQCVVVWGNTSQGVAWSSIQAGSQTTHAHTRANYAAAMAGKKTLQELAAAEMGGNADAYRVGGSGVSGPGGSLTWAQAAERAIARGGKFDGHEVPADLNAMTKASAAALAGLGVMGVARDGYPRDGQTYGFVAGFAEVEVDVETGVYRVVDYVGVADVGTVVNPRSLAAQIFGGAIQGMSHVRSQKMVYDTHYGVAIGKRMYQNKPPTILDQSVDMKWEAVNIPDPGNPVVGAKGIGEPGIGVGGAVVLCALANAIGDDLLKRTPVQPEHIVTALREGRVTYEPLTAYI